ncbi:Long-chain-alcohol oxidase FAO4A [Camellia lanceoleosa]|uniref:Long-chain-alcohol oxidase FAO4A n=1 Tax=Camellia lanceoleosa TaxID=1840588 RepID=A0ACC0G3W6_9ERIC|nr:Long-chain-alcohol oxidase FAO4A [Camellia lanceoleosa]
MDQDGAEYTSSPESAREELHAVIELGSIDSQRLIDGVGGGERTQPPSKSLSSAQMESLSALCDTFLPSINVSNGTTIDDDSLATFYRTSASMAGTQHQVEELIMVKLQHPKLFLMRLTLWLLSTWIGTLILCGRASLSSHFPYFQRFSKVSQQKREEIVYSWSVSFIYLQRMFFLSLKFLILLTFFTQINDEDENLSWKAIGYCGPDPDFKMRTKKNKKLYEMGYLPSEDQGKEKDVDKEELFGPLYKGLIHLNNPRQIIAETLRRSGFQVSIPHKKNTKPNSLTPTLIIKCDAVVVGSGSGGGVIAGVLAKAGYKVLVLEKGKYYARSKLSLLEGPTMDQMYMGNGLLATEDMGVVVLAGSTVGGGSTVNWSASIRTPQHVLKEWSEQCELELFDSILYKEALDVVCEKMGVQNEFNDEGFHNAVLRSGCHELGYPVNTIPRNSQANHYCGWCCFGCKDGRKKGTSETWLVDLVNSGNGAILPSCQATKVLHKRKKGRDRSTTTGVAFEFQYKGFKEVCIVESKVTVVACGALSTPSLLKRSGLKNPNIGKNLHLHPVTMAWGYFPDNPLPNTWPEVEKKSYEGGIMTAMSTVVGNFSKSGYGAVIQTPALHPGMFSVLMPWVSGIDIKMRMCKFSRTAHIFALARDKGSGEVVSPSSISYRMDKIDEENLKRGLEKVLRILAAAGAEEIGTHHCNGKTLNVKQVSSHEFEKFVKKESSRSLRNLLTPICSAHQMGSCRMGVDPKGSAVNQMGETWEVEGLYVADSSVFPTALGVNPMVTVQAIAYCTAQSVLEVLKRKKNL